MKLSDFRIGWRLLVQEPAYSAVVIFGLALGFAVCFLLLGFVNYSFTYDRQVPDSERVYLIKSSFYFPGMSGQWGAASSVPSRDAALASGLKLDATNFIQQTALSVRVGDVVLPVDFAVVDPGFPRIFGVKAIAGDLQAALSRPNGVALTSETAERLFHGADVLGKTLQIAGRTYTVMAVVPVPPANTTAPYAALAPFEGTILTQEQKDELKKNWGSSSGAVYLKLGPGVTPEAVAAAIGNAMQRSPWFQKLSSSMTRNLGDKHIIEFKLGALQDAYFDPEVTLGVDPAAHGDRKIILGLAATGLLILLLAATNYVNLATVRTLRRQREIGVRKVLGASVERVAAQFLAESVLVSMIATACGLLLAWLLLPLFADLVNRKLDAMFTPASIAVTLAAGFVVGLLSGAYPTWVAVRVRPTQALAGRGSAETVSGMWLRRVLTVLQFATAMGLTGLTLAIAWQTRHASELSPGFDPAPLLVVDMPDDLRNPAVTAFRDALKRLPGVVDVAVSLNPVARNNNNNNSNMQLPGQEPITMNMQTVTPEFFGTYGIRPLAGRVYDPRLDQIAASNAVVVNLSAAQKLGFATPQAAVGQFVKVGRNDRQIVGVIADLRHRSLREPPEGVAYPLSERVQAMAVRAAGDLAPVREGIETLWQRHFPNDILVMNSARSFVELQYADDLRLAKLLTASAAVAIVIAAFGIYVLAAYSVQRRAREIVLRKLYGAGRGAIARLVGREFVTLIGAGALIGLPVAAVATERYLSSFADRAPIGAWTLLLALAIAAVVAFLSTLRHTLTAVHIAPALALRA
jgi:putative ABC transport system permease protein